MLHQSRNMHVSCFVAEQELSTAIDMSRRLQPSGGGTLNRPMSLPLAIIASLWLALPASRAEAEPITFTYSGWAHGSMNGTPLTPAPVYFQLMATADTSAVKSCETSRHCFYVRNDTASTTITGWGTFDFITPTQMITNWGGRGPRLRTGVVFSVARRAARGPLMLPIVCGSVPMVASLQSATMERLEIHIRQGDPK